MPTKADLEVTITDLQHQVRRLERSIGQAQLDLQELPERLATTLDRSAVSRAQLLSTALWLSGPQWSRSQTAGLTPTSGQWRALAGHGRKSTRETVNSVGVARFWRTVTRR